MTNAARKDVQGVEPESSTQRELQDDLARLVRVLDRLVTVEERKLAARGSAERRALKQAGPTTDEALAAVQRRMRKVRSK